MGFKKVIQSKAGVNVSSTALSNSNVMNYLKHVVPKMFQVVKCLYFDEVFEFKKINFSEHALRFE